MTWPGLPDPVVANLKPFLANFPLPAEDPEFWRYVSAVTDDRGRVWVVVATLAPPEWLTKSGLCPDCGTPNAGDLTVHWPSCPKGTP